MQKNSMGSLTNSEIKSTNKMFSKKTETLKKNQIEILELKNLIKQMKNELAILGNRADQKV